MKWHSDPGHAWLEVKKELLIKLGIKDKISYFSYEKGSRVFLEEDCDASTFLEAYFEDKNWFKKPECKSEFNRIPIKYYKKEASLQNYASYSK